MNTQLVNQWNIDKAVADSHHLTINAEQAYKHYIKNDITLFINESENNNSHSYQGELYKLLNAEYQKIEQELHNERWVELSNAIYFDKKAGGYWIIIPGNNELYKKFASGTPLSEVHDHLNSTLKDPINQWIIPSLTKLKRLTQLSGNLPFTICKGRIAITPIALFAEQNLAQGFHCDDNCCHKFSSGDSIPFLKLTIKDIPPRQLFIDFLKKGLSPKTLINSLSYKILLALFHQEITELAKQHKESVQTLLQREYKKKLQGTIIDILLNEDNIRADIAPYHQKMLEDTNLGHWSLWPNEHPQADTQTVEWAPPLVARDPKSSINDGVVAIDFGTKSTVVVYQKDNVNIHPMRVGIGDLSHEIAAYHYENPTIMEFNNLERFSHAKCQPTCRIFWF